MIYKKNSFFNFPFILSVFVFFIFISCSNINNQTNNNKTNDTNTNPKVGYLSLVLKNNLISEQNNDSTRQAISLYDLEDLVSNYELLIFNQTEMQRIPFVIDDTEISIPVGSWNLIILAGTKKSYLVGSGYYNDLTIEENKISEISIDLFPIDISITADKEILYCNQTVTITVSVDTRNPYLLADYVCLNSARLNLLQIDSSSKSSGSREFTASSTPETLVFKYSTSGLKFNNETLQEDFLQTATFTSIVNTSVYEKENMTIKSYEVKKEAVNTGVNMLLTWVE